ncbi:unnamed protein product [Symbiodinium sp. CCMP2592]|nr:unnamed protein product [Symbiodinium sp. CCMP2592]
MESACAGAYSAASSAVWWAASLPPTCRESMAHAALTCSGATPRYFTPGFGPLALGWGWLVVGVLIDLLSRRAVSAVVALAGGRPSPHTPSNWEALMCELAARTQDPHRHEVLQYILQGGETALDELSQASGRTSASLLAHLLADDAVADGAAQRPARRRTTGRVGEAAHPGPPCGAAVAQRRERAMHALAQMQLLPSTRPAALRDRQADLDAAETLSDLLSTITPFASPRGEAPDALTGAMAPDAAGEATRGFTPPSTPPVTDQGGACTGYDARQVVPPASGVAPLPWQDARPPSSAPGERSDATPGFTPPASPTLLPAPAREPLCWRDVFVAVRTTAPRRCRRNDTGSYAGLAIPPRIGTRFAELAGALRRAAPALPSTILRFLHAELACIDRDPAHGAAAADVASAEALTAMPPAPVPLPSALALCMNAQGLSLNGVGPDVISIHHQCHDRAVTFDFVGSLSGWWSKQVGVSEAAAGPAAADSDDEKLFEWHSWTACAAHDGHNSCKWGHQGLFNDSFLLESCYVGVMAMRACFHHAASHLADWLVQVLSPKRQDELPAVSDLFLLWCALGIDQDIAKLLSEMQLFWLGGTLVVLHSVLDDSNWLEAISTCLLSVWRPPAFTTSRWCTVGASCRGLLSGLVTGYPAFLQWLHTAGKLGDYEWHGCKRLDAKVWHFAAVVGLSSYVSDSFLAKVLKDSRVAQTQQSLQEVLWNEFLFLDVLPQQFWDMLSGPVQMTSQAVRSGVIAGALISWSFLEWRVLLVASSLPWRLCSGSVEANVDELLQQAEPPDTGIAFKIWALGQAGYNRTRLARAVQLLGQCSWTSAFTEKQHGSTSVVKKRHPDYGDNHLTARAFIHTFAQMLPSSSACDQRQVYLAHVMQKAREKEASDPKQPRYNRAKIMKLHGQQWTSLPEESKASWDRQAAFERSATWQSRQKECDNLKQQLGLLSEAGSGSDSKAPGSSMLISQCRLSTSEQCRLQSMIDDSKLTEKSVEKLRAKSLQCPPPVPDQDLDSCLGHSQLRRDRPTEMPATARRICQMRDHFAQSVFLVEHPQGSRFYRFLFAMLNPVRLFLLDLGDLECPVPAVTSGPPCFNQQWQASVPWQWSFLPGRFSSAEVFDVSPNVQIGVFLHSWFSSEGSLCSRDVLQPLDLILDAAASEKKVAKDPDKSAQSHATFDCEGTDDADFSSEDIQYDDLFEQLEEQRCVINAAFETLADQFRTSLIGGDWQLRRTGRVVYGVRIDVKAGSSMAEFCAKFSLAKSAGFEQSVYGDEPGQALGKLFIHRMSFLMQLWEDLGRPDHGIPADRLTDYVPAPDLETVLSTTTGRVQQRYRKILALAPKAPRAR